MNPQVSFFTNFIPKSYLQFDSKISKHTRGPELP